MLSLNCQYKRLGMNVKKEKSIEAIRKIISDIDTVKFGDQEAWQSIRFELDAVVQNFPRKISVPLKTIGLCLEGVQAITAQRGRRHLLPLSKPYPMA